MYRAATRRIKTFWLNGYLKSTRLGSMNAHPEDRIGTSACWQPQSPASELIGNGAELGYTTQTVISTSFLDWFRCNVPAVRNTYPSKKPG